MNILAIDVGGSHVKFRLKDQTDATKFTSGPTMTAEEMATQVVAATKDWQYDGVSIGYPGPVLKDKPIAEPANLGNGWTTFDFAAAFSRPVKIINDAAMQALGSYEGDKMLFLGFGTGLGSAMVCEGKVLPMELAHLPFRKRTFETYVGANGLERLGRKKWRIRVLEAIEVLRAALLPDYVVLGGGNARNIETPPSYCRLGSNKNAFLGGFRLWDNALEPPPLDGIRSPTNVFREVLYPEVFPLSQALIDFGKPSLRFAGRYVESILTTFGRVDERLHPIY